MSEDALPPLPDYLVEAVARRAFERDRVGAAAWEDLDDVAREGYLEMARVSLRAQSVQSDIKR